MRCWSRVLILLTVALVALNAQCFANCLTQTCGKSAPHCHQHGQGKSVHCSLQHDVVTSSVRVAMPGAVLMALVKLPALFLNSLPHQFVELFASSPPTPVGKATPLPLRV
ncbi:MAG TPA: hypothetical protein VGP62_30960 [Bryobacteraceae bacterium]|nr:hypothetical protein [Bryobacteraceae bacterium]